VSPGENCAVSRGVSYGSGCGHGQSSQLVFVWCLCGPCANVPLDQRSNVHHERIAPPEFRQTEARAGPHRVGIAVTTLSIRGGAEDQTALGAYLRRDASQLRPEDSGSGRSAIQVRGSRGTFRVCVARAAIGLPASARPTTCDSNKAVTHVRPPQVVDAACRALPLDGKGIEYLHRLASATASRASTH